MNNLLRIILCLVLPIFCFALHTVQAKEDTNNSSSLNKVEKKLANIYLYINKYTKKMDEKITGDKSQDMFQNSRIHFETYYEIKDKDKNKLGSYFSFALDFPLLEKKLSYVFHNNEKKTTDNKSITPPNKNTSLIKKAKNYTKIKVKGGLIIYKKPYLYLRLKLKKEYSNLWQSSFKEEIQVSKNGDFYNISTLSLQRNINFHLNIKNTNTYKWDDKDKISKFINALELNHKLSYKKTLKYRVSINTNNDNSNMKVKDYDFGIEYKHKTRKWLYFKLEPKIHWEEENNFKNEYSLRFTMGMIIGK